MTSSSWSNETDVLAIRVFALGLSDRLREVQAELTTKINRAAHGAGHPGTATRKLSEGPD